MIPSNIKEMLKEIRYIFTKEYQKECQYIEFKQSMKDKIKLKCDADESIDEKIDRLRKHDLEEAKRLGVINYTEQQLAERSKNLFVGAYEGDIFTENQLLLKKIKVNSKKSKF